MPVIYQKIIKREDLIANPNVHYVFGDNIMRRGLGGQAKEMRGEPNAIGVVTKNSPGTYNEDFFDDKDFEKVTELMSKDLVRIEALLNKSGTIVFPSDGIGTGRGELYLRAPKIARWLSERFLLIGIINGKTI